MKIASMWVAGIASVVLLLFLLSSVDNVENCTEYTPDSGRVSACETQWSFNPPW